MIQAAHCTACGAKTWRGLVRPDTQEWVPLFPDPTSVYVRLATAEGIAVGPGYCRACAPPVDAPGPVEIASSGRPLGPSTVVGYQTAPERYTSWYSEKYGDWLATWTQELSREFRTSEDEWAPLLAQWQEDRMAVPVPHA